ncbi:hypothetical protein MKW92_025508 [Papaver armeniacum]|nr:hypothetical protein MKW92_025508 [Papaver armeniacum]
MAAEHLPLILILRRFPFISSFNERFYKKFRALNGYDLQIPLNQYLPTIQSESNSVKAIICSAHTPVTSETIDLLPSLGCVITFSAGLDHIDLVKCRRRGIVIGNAGGIYSEDVADLAVGLLIDALRKMSAADRYVRSGLWALNGNYPLGSSGKRIGIVGLGSIGWEVAKRLEAFGCIISYNSRTKKPSVPFPYYPNVIDLALNNDVLSRLIDENELVQYLVQGKIGGAGLDVFENEPHVPSKIFGMDNVVLSPHNAIGTVESRTALHELILSNLDAFFQTNSYRL